MSISVADLKKALESLHDAGSTALGVLNAEFEVSRYPTFCVVLFQEDYIESIVLLCFRKSIVGYLI